MSRSVYLLLLIGGAFTLVIMAMVRPEWLGDENAFLGEFINHELLNILGVILAITLASIAQIHLKLNEIEGRLNEEIMSGSRQELKSSAVWLISLFAVSIILAFSKSLVAECGMAASLINAGSLWILLFNVLILADITLSIFGIKSIIVNKQEGHRNDES